MDNNLTIKERILQLAKVKKLTMEEFCNKIDMSYANFKGEAKKRPINSNTIVKLFTIFPDINLKWLLLGEGAIIEQGTQQGTEGASASNHELVKYLENKVKEKEQALEICLREQGRLEGLLEADKKERKAG